MVHNSWIDRLDWIRYDEIDTPLDPPSSLREIRGSHGWHGASAGINRYGDVWTFHFGTNDPLAC